MSARGLFPRFSSCAVLLGFALGGMVCTARAGDIAPQGGEPWSQSGWFSVVWGDGAGGGARTVYTLTDDGGRTTPLLIDEELSRSLGGVLSFDRRYVDVRGVSSSAFSGLGGAEAVSVSSVSLAQPLGAEASSGGFSPAVVGSKPWVTVMCKFSDYAVEPENLAFFQGMYSGAKPGLDHYWRELSYDTANVSGSGASGWFTLPHPEAYYNPTDSNGGTNLTLLCDECVAAADASVNFSLYAGINMVFNADFDNGWAWGGGRYMTLDGVSKAWSTTWEPPWAYADISVIQHEMGHGFGLPHSSGAYGQTYDNAWDVMSKDRYNCAAATDPTYGCVAQHTISYHKDRSGWIPAEQKHTAGAGADVTLTLEQLALPATGNYKMVQIPIPGSSTRFYTVEARRQTGYDTKLAGPAVIIHEVDTTRARPAYVIDADGNGDTGDAGAMWTAGETFSDAASGIYVSVLSATATGFQVNVKNNAVAVAAGVPDFNKDGKADILWRSGATGDLYAWYMNGAAKLGAGVLGTVSDQGWRVAGSGDFDSDGKTDILWRNCSTGENYVWYMDGPTQAGGGPIGAVSDSAWKIAGVADFDSDGKPDVLWRNTSTGENHLWFMDGLVQKGASPVEAVPDTGWKIAGAGDFNGDGKPDILWRNGATGANYAWFMNGALHAGGAFLVAVADPAWLIAWVGDYDGDGDADVLWRNSATGDNVLWTMAGTARETATYLDAVADQAWRMWDAEAPRVLGVPSDFDLDGKADVLWRSAATGELYVWTMDGVLRKGAGASIGAVADAGWKVAGMADFNSDGDTDLLWRNYGTGENYVWYMDGLVQKGGEAVEAVGDLNWWVAGTGDFNSDGKPDLLWRNYSTGANCVWYMDGAAKTGSAPLDPVGDAAWKIAGAADFDGDGKPDILWRNAATGQVYIWTMDGVAHVGGSDLGVVPMEWVVAWTADYSGDGNPDILWRNTATGDNHVWYIAGAVQVGGAPMDPVGDLAWEIMPQVYPLAGGWKAGDLYDVDAVVGNLRYVPSTVEAGARLPRWLAGGFVQGSPADEPCREPWGVGTETQFTHTLTKSFAVMETEVARQMWADLKAARPTLPSDPADTTRGAGMSNPVQSVTWYEAVLFANLLSLQRGLTPCYYADAGFATPITSANYQTDSACCDSLSFRLARSLP